MEDTSDTESSSDSTAKWVKKLRSRFAVLGLAAKTHENGGLYNSNINGFEGDHTSSDYHYGKVRGSCSSDSDSSLLHQQDERRTVFERTNPERSSSSSISNGNSSVANCEMPSCGNRLISTPLYGVNSGKTRNFSCESEGSFLASESSEPPCLTFDKHKSPRPIVSKPRLSYESGTSNDFYVKPKSVSSTSSWGKHDWTMSNGHGSPDSDDEPPLRLTTSSDDNVDLMLGWWGLDDMTENPELSKYLSKKLPASSEKPAADDYGKLAKNSGNGLENAGKPFYNPGKSVSGNSRKSSRNSGNRLENSRKLAGNSGKSVGDIGKSAWDSGKSARNSGKFSGYSMPPHDTENGHCSNQHFNNDEVHDSGLDFHVFPVGFDGIEPPTSGNCFEQVDVPGDHSYSSSDSDYTNDDPLPKPKSPRSPTDGVMLSGYSPRNLTPHGNGVLAYSKSPPEPQIHGSLYHGFSNENQSGIERCENVQGMLSDDDDDLMFRAGQRPRSRSQPNSIKSFDKTDLLDQKVHDSCDRTQSSSFGNELRYKSSQLNANAKPFLQRECTNIDKLKLENVCEGVSSLSAPKGERLSTFISTNDTQPNLFRESRVCSECNAVNNVSEHWCIECGLALIDMSPTVADQSSKMLKQLKQNSTSNKKPSNSRTNFSRSSATPDGRRWEKSSLAWNTYEDSHLSKPPAGRNCKSSNKSRQSSAVRREVNNARPRSASCKTSGKKLDGGFTNNEVVHHGSWPRSNEMQGLRDKKKSGSVEHSNSTEMSVKGRKATGKRVQKRSDLKINLTGLNDYHHGEITTGMIWSNRGDPLPYLCLPDEVILHIFGYLTHIDLANCAQVCQQLRRICEDDSLWRTITLRKNKHITDKLLEKIGSKKPVNLSLILCRGNEVTASGLRELFRQCGENLEELNFSGCNGGQFIGESILLHVALRCTKLHSIDASWSNVGDNGIEALVQNIERLECLCLNGCQAITDHSLNIIGERHGKTLKTFEIFGCFNVSVNGIKKLGKRCPNLSSLSLGQCYKITSNGIGQIVSHLEYIVNLDLRGCKQARDGCVKMIARHCPLLVNLVLANCQHISDIAMTEIATKLPSVEYLDICGCVKVTDQGVRALAQSCNRLNYLDLSSTGITKKSVVTLANYCSQNLQSLKLSFCVDVTDDSVSHLVRHCKRMTILHLYGCKRLRNMEALQKLNRSLKVEF